MNDRSLVAIVNALEGYRLNLQRDDVPKEYRACLERLYKNTLQEALQVSLPVQPYERWMRKYKEA